MNQPYLEGTTSIIAPTTGSLGEYHNGTFVNRRGKKTVLLPWRDSNTIKAVWGC
jgi:hypothetical protein